MQGLFANQNVNLQCNEYYKIQTIEYQVKLTCQSASRIEGGENQGQMN